MSRSQVMQAKIKWGESKRHLLHFQKLLFLLVLFFAEIFGGSFAVITQNCYLKVAIVEEKELFVVFHLELLLHSQGVSEKKMKIGNEKHNNTLPPNDASCLHINAAERTTYSCSARHWLALNVRKTFALNFIPGMCATRPCSTA